MKYLFIIQNYHLSGDSTAITSKQYVRYLASKGEDVSVLCFDNFKLSRDLKTTEDGVKCINLLDERSIKALKYSKEVDYFGLNPIQKAVIQLSAKLKRIGKIKTNEWPLDALSYKKIISHLDAHYDVLISVSSPFYSHVLASYLKRKGIADKWYAMLWDPYVFNYTMPNKLSGRKTAAIKAFKNVDRIYCSDGIINGNKKEGFEPEYLKKCSDIKYPGLKPLTKSEVKKSKDRVLLYTGTFYEDIRNPKEMFNILDKLPSEYHVHLYSKGCDGLVKQKLNDRYSLFEQVKPEEVAGLINNCNIVINLGNTITNQIPGKIFELISSGKPIINFYFSSDDPSLKYFDKYQLCYSLNLSSYTEDDVNELIKFIKENDNKTLSFIDATVNLCEYKSEVAIKEFFENL